MASTRAVPCPPLDLAPATMGPVGPSLLVNALVTPGWSAWRDRLAAVATRACLRLNRAERRAQRVTVTVTWADGREIARSVALPRATDRLEAVLPAGLGLLRLLLAESPRGVSHVGLTLGALVEGANQPVRFERYLARRRPQGFARVAALVASIAGLSSFFTLR